MHCLCRVLFMPDSFSLIWGHLVHFAAKFPILIFSIGYCPHSINPVSTNRMESVAIGGRGLGCTGCYFS